MKDISLLNQIRELIDEKLTELQISQKKIMTVEELSVYLSLQPAYIRKMTHNREIPYYKPGGKKLYFLREEIDEWVLSSRISTAEEIRSEAKSRARRL